MNKKQQSELNKLPLKERAAYFAGGRVSVGTITQVQGKTLVNYFVGKVRGVPVTGESGRFCFDTEPEARDCAESFLNHAKWQAKSD